MKQRYEIPLPLDEVKERLRADMQTDWPLGKLLRSVKSCLLYTSPSPRD